MRESNDHGKQPTIVPPLPPAFGATHLDLGHCLVKLSDAR
jgi:hypothetical protein